MNRFSTKIYSGNQVTCQFIPVKLLSCVWLFVTPWMPGFSVHHQLPEFTQTHVHWVGDAIQPSHPLSSPSPPAFNLSQYQGLFKWVSSSHQMAKVLEFQHQAFQWIFPLNMNEWFPLWWTGWISFQSKGLSRVFQHHSLKESILWQVTCHISSNSMVIREKNCKIFVPTHKPSIQKFLKTPCNINIGETMEQNYLYSSNGNVIHIISLWNSLTVSV